MATPLNITLKHTYYYRIGPFSHLLDTLSANHTSVSLPNVAKRIIQSGMIASKPYVGKRKF